MKLLEQKQLHEKQKIENQEIQTQQAQSLRCFYTNPTKFTVSKMNEFLIQNECKKYDIICMTETWFTDISIVHIEGYTLFRRDRLTDAHGGVCIYIKNELCAFEVILDQLNDPEIEQIWCEVVVNTEKILIGCIYKANDKFDTKICRSLIEARNYLDNKKCDGILIVGDFNLRHTMWENGLATIDPKGTEKERNMIELFEDCFLYQSVDFPNFKMHSSFSNTLELILSECSLRVYNVTSLPGLGDLKWSHICLEWDYLIKYPRIKEKFQRCDLNFKKGDYFGLNSAFDETDWSLDLHTESTNECNIKFVEIFKKLCGKFIPIKKQTSRNFLKWSSSELRTASREKRKLWYKNEASNWNNIQMVSIYNNAVKMVSKLAIKDTRSFEKNIANEAKHKPKVLHQYIKSKQKVNSEIRQITLNGQTHTETKEIANALNKHFHSVFTVDDEDNLPAIDTFDIVNSSFPLDSISNDNIASRLVNLNPDKAFGSDGVSPFVLKQCSNSLSIPLEILFKKSILTGIVPSNWREANVTAIFKKGSRMDPSNYRPVSLTAVLSKVIEGFVKDHIMQHLVTNKIVSLFQHGFVRSKSCTTNLLESLDFISRTLSQGVSVDVLYTDFSKAFDKVNHRLLIHKLRAFGIDDLIVRWIQHWLADRKQRVVMGASESE